MTLRGGDSQSANISAHRVRLHVIIRFRAQGNRSPRKYDIHHATISCPSLNSLDHSGIVKNTLWCDYNTIFPLESRSPRRNIYSPLSVARSLSNYTCCSVGGRPVAAIAVVAAVCAFRRTCFVTYLPWPASLTFARVCPRTGELFNYSLISKSNAIFTNEGLARLYDPLVHR